MKKIIGLDIAKKSFQYATFENDKKVNFKFSYDKKEDVYEFVKKMGIDESCLVVMEATGTYSMVPAIAFSKAGATVVVENPLVVKRFNQMRRNITKTDKKDAELLLDYAKMNSEELRPFQAPSAELQKIKQRRLFLESLKSEKQAYESRLESILQYDEVDDFAVAEIKDHINNIAQRIKKVKEAIRELANEDTANRQKLLKSVPGVGDVLAELLNDAFEGFMGITEPGASKKFIKHIGLAPSQHESGTSVKKGGHITRSALPVLRAKLYMGAAAAVYRAKGESIFKDTYNRLKAKGKSHKQALVAVMKKIVYVAIACVRDNTSYDDKKHGLPNNIR